MLAKVVHVKATEGGSWALGCRFISELSDTEVERLLGVIPGAGNDAVPSETPAQVQDKTARDVRLRLALRQGAVVDCIIRRFKTAEACPVPAGKVIAVRGGSADEPWTLNVRVRQCLQRQEH